MTARSSEDMYLAAGHGKCVEVFHVIGDTLCQLCKPPSRPDLGLPSINSHTNTEENIESINQETIVDQTEILSVKLDEVDLSETSGDVIKDEIISEVNILKILLKIEEDKLIAFMLFRNI